MTKEVIKRPSSEPVTIANNANQALYKNFREWREYASALEEDVKNLSERVIELDEHSQDEKDARKKEYDIHQEIYSKTSRKLNKAELEIVNLKSQLQQQALPVVPECVAKELYNIDFNYWIENKMTLACFTARTLNWLEQHREDWNIEYYICKLRFGGFTIEKPQLFYLKHIDMSKADKECDWYLITDCVKLCHEWVGKNLKPKDDDFKFTQQEIDSMETGSYEQIEVTECFQ